MLNYIKAKILSVLLATTLLLTLPAAAMAQTHTVAKGDSIYKISQWYKVDQYALRYANGTWNDMLQVGQKIAIPAKHTVKNGETVYTIAKSFGTDTKKVAEINQLRSPNLLNTGQVLYIPPAQGAVKTTNPTTSTPQNSNYRVSRAGGRVSDADFDALARIITAEADSESYETQVAVGAVVLNRVDSPLFPNTIRGVIYQVDAWGKYQFEPVLNGWINRPASESGKKAAMDALKGWDPSNGSLFFFESWVTNKFLTSRPLSKVMDSFTFTY